MWLLRMPRMALSVLVTLQSRLPADGRSVALTFDDGPDPTFTPQVLDALRDLDVKATFFVVGKNARQFPGIVRRIVAEGHGLGSHTASHARPRSLGLADLVADYVRGRRQTERAAARKVRLFRPPWGFVGTHENIAMRTASLSPWLWTIDPGDWQPDITADELLLNLQNIDSGDVVLLHDGSESPLAPSARDRSATVKLLPPLVAHARKRGLSFVTLPEPGRGPGGRRRARR
jgi:peptidoglycan/xylan/chitin deacetylase (PgdA/CDA1 family)